MERRREGEMRWEEGRGGVVVEMEAFGPWPGGLWEKGEELSVERG